MHHGAVSTMMVVGWMPRTGGALAVELVDLVEAVAVVQAGAAGTLVCVDLAVNPLVTCGETRRTVSAEAWDRHNAQDGHLHPGVFGPSIFTKAAQELCYRRWDLTHELLHGCPPQISLPLARSQPASSARGGAQSSADGAQLSPPVPPPLRENM